MQVGLLILAPQQVPESCSLVAQAGGGPRSLPTVLCDSGTWYLRMRLQRLLQHTTPMPASCSRCLWRWPWRQVRVQ